MEPWLPRCLDDVFAALPASAEAIAVDDGSTDATLRLLRERAASELRLRVIAASHAGVSAARNRALDAVRGRYVFFVDPDDGVEPDYFTAMVGELERSGADTVLCGYSEREDGAETVRDVLPKANYAFGSNAEIVARYLPLILGYSFADIRAWYGGTPLFARREMASACRMVFRRELIESGHVRFDESVSLYEDAMFIADYLLIAKSMVTLPCPLYRVTCRNSGAMRSVPRDGVRYCRNKLALLRKREALDFSAGGTLAPLYAGTNVLSVLEIVSFVVRRRVPLREARQVLRDYLSVPSVRAAIRAFPLSVRRPLLAASVLTLRLLGLGR